jgi:hypothetical protein
MRVLPELGLNPGRIGPAVAGPGLNLDEHLVARDDGPNDDIHLAQGTGLATFEERRLFDRRLTSKVLMDDPDDVLKEI